METQPWKEFSLPQDVGLRNKLEEKRKEYWRRMIEPDPKTGWKSWEQCDLTNRYNNDPSFRLLYYELIIITDILMACEKHKKILEETGHNGLPDMIESRLIGISLSGSLGRPIVPDEFETACKVIYNYLTDPTALN